MNTGAGLDYRRGWEARDLSKYARDSGLALRVAAILNALSPLRIRSALELGAGPGFVASAVRAHLGVFAFATDVAAAFDPSLVGCCAVADGCSMPFRDRSFDVVIASEVLEHLDTPQVDAVAREMLRVASRFALVTVPNHEPLSVELVTCRECYSQFNSSGHLHSMTEQRVAAAFGKAPSSSVPIDVDRTPPRGSAFLLTLLRWGLNPSWEPGEFTCPLCKTTNVFDTPERARVHFFLRAKAMLHRLGSPRPRQMLYVFEK